MKYTKIIKKDLTKAMSMYRQQGKTIKESSSRTAKFLKQRHKKTYTDSSISAMYYELRKAGKTVVQGKDRTTVTTVPSNATRDLTTPAVREVLMSLVKDSENITIEVNGKGITVVFK